MFSLGGMYFKRSAVLKTVLTLFIIGFVYSGIMGMGTKAFFEQANETMQINIESNEAMQITLWRAKVLIETVTYITLYLFVPYLWVMSYFKLTEKEV